MNAYRCFILIFALMSLAVANSTNAQLRVEDRVKVGDITIKYDSNRWMLSSGNAATKAQLECRGPNCGINLRIEVEDTRNVCRADTVNDLLLQRMSRVTNEEFRPYVPRLRKVQQFGKMTMHIARAYNGCHVQTDFVFACGEYRGKTYSMWLTPDGCVIKGGTGSSERMMNGLLSGIVAP